MTAWLTDTLITTGALIALVLVLRRPVSRWLGAPMAYALWSLPVLRLLLPPLVLPAEMAPVAEAMPQPAEPVTLTYAAFETVPEAAPAPVPLQAGLPWDEILLSIWLGGALAFIAWRVWTYSEMRRRLLASARPVGEAARVRLVETPDVTAPLAFGVFDKVVALPAGFMGQEDRFARDLAIAHELAHHKGHDLLANFAAQLVLALHWFNPLAWYGWRAMRRDQEAACDARVMAGRAEAERARYALLIANFATGSRFALAAPMACPILGEKSIIHRLRSLAMPDISRRRRVAGKAGFLAAILALPLTATITYAEASAQVEEVPVPPSAPAAPEAPMPPAAPDAPEPPEAPEAPDIAYEIRAARMEADEARKHADKARELAERHRAIAMEMSRRHAGEAGELADEARRHADEMRREAMKVAEQYRVMMVDENGRARNFTFSGENAFDEKEFEKLMEGFEERMSEFEALDRYFAEGGPFEKKMRKFEAQMRKFEMDAVDCEDDETVTRKLSDGKEIVIRCTTRLSRQNVSMVTPVSFVRASAPSPASDEACKEKPRPARSPRAVAIVRVS
jgi:beta-lactamase regulating signal transducer with metallopeptidase domain